MGRPAIRLALQAIGVALVVLGALWALQGAGIVMWPASSSMLAQREWALYGAITAMVGVVLVILAHRIGRAD